MSDFLKLAGTVGDAVMGVMNANQQGGILHQMRSNANQAIPAQTWENIRRIQEARQAGQTGSGTPALLGANEAIDDYRVLAEQQANQQNALYGASQMMGPAGGIERLIAQLTGGLGGQYSIDNMGHQLGSGIESIFGKLTGGDGDLNPVGQVFNMGMGGFSGGSPDFTNAMNTLGNLTSQGFFAG